MMRCSTSLIIGEMPIKSIMRYNPTPVRMAIPENMKDNKCWQHCAEIGNFVHCGWIVKWCGSYEKLYEDSSKKVKTELLCDPAFQILDMSKTVEIRISGRGLHPHVHCTTVDNSQGMETTQVPMCR